MFSRLRDDGRPLLMGILNVTADSFSDGGHFLAPSAALAHAERMVDEGADIIDVGGESTRPGADAITEAAQIERVVPVLEVLTAQLPARIALSIDTRSPLVARAALDAGARIVNDVSAATAPGMLELAAARGCGLVLMHMQGTPATMQQAPHYDDVVAEVGAFLRARAAAAGAAGVAHDAIAIDPGIGFGKNRAHNLALLTALDQLVASGHHVLLGTSRKRFMGAICAESVAAELVGATCATTALAVHAGVRIVRVHDVKANRQAADVAWVLRAPVR